MVRQIKTKPDDPALEQSAMNGYGHFLCYVYNKCMSKSGNPMGNDPFLAAILEGIATHDFLSYGDHWLLAVSGGPSVLCDISEVA